MLSQPFLQLGLQPFVFQAVRLAQVPQLCYPQGLQLRGQGFENSPATVRLI